MNGSLLENEPMSKHTSYGIGGPALAYITPQDRKDLSSILKFAIENKIPAIEIHLSNTYSREEIRHKSLTAGACVGQIMGFQENSYNLGMSAIIKLLNTNNG